MYIIIKNKSQLYNLKKDDEFLIGGMLYKVIEPYNETIDSILVVCYKDYPTGGFDYKNPYSLSYDYI
ncbi:MAG: hypothetical protein IJZ64_00625 [Ruminococcus sp.]|nr:hypothetical protein [Ruminococcus sp.]